MSELKTLNLRIQQKYDSVQNWAVSSLTLLAGELALDDQGGVKIGDGNSTWSELPFITDALANQITALASTLSASIVLVDDKIDAVDNKVDRVDSDMQNGFALLEQKTFNIDNRIDQINTDIQMVINNEIPTTSLVNPSDPDDAVIIDCGTASSNSKS